MDTLDLKILLTIFTTRLDITLYSATFVKIISDDNKIRLYRNLNILINDDNFNNRFLYDLGNYSVYILDLIKDKKYDIVRIILENRRYKKMNYYKIKKYIPKEFLKGYFRYIKIKEIFNVTEL